MCISTRNWLFKQDKGLFTILITRKIQLLVKEILFYEHHKAKSCGFCQVAAKQVVAEVVKSDKAIISADIQDKAIISADIQDKAIISADIQDVPLLTLSD